LKERQIPKQLNLLAGKKKELVEGADERKKNE
jgi:hypothetical protein